MQWIDRIGCRLKLHDLHIFLTVAEMGSMGKAAERLALSQPSVSKAIANIEHAIGVPLFDRTPRGVETTAYGRALLRRGSEAFGELNRGIKDIEFLTDPTVGEVRVGCPEAFASGLLTKVLANFSRQYPRVIVRAYPANNMSREFRLLRDHDVDFLLGAIATPLEEEDLEVEVLYDDRPFIVSGKANRWAGRRKVELAELVDEPWLLPLESIFSSILAEAFQSKGLAVPKMGVRSYSVYQRLQSARHRPLYFVTAWFRRAIQQRPILTPSIAGRFCHSVLPSRRHYVEEPNGQPCRAHLHRLRP